MFGMSDGGDQGQLMFINSIRIYCKVVEAGNWHFVWFAMVSATMPGISFFECHSLQAHLDQLLAPSPQVRTSLQPRLPSTKNAAAPPVPTFDPALCLCLPQFRARTALAGLIVLSKANLSSFQLPWGAIVWLASWRKRYKGSGQWVF